MRGFSTSMCAGSVFLGHPGGPAAGEGGAPRRPAEGRRSTRVRLLRQITDEATRCKGSGWLAFSCLLLHPAGPGLLCGGPVPHHRLIQPPAAGEVIAFEPLLGQNAARDIAPQAALADNVHRLAYRDFPQPLPQVIHREVNKALRVAVGVLAGGPHVQQRHTAVPGQGVHILREELLHQSHGTGSRS